LASALFPVVVIADEWQTGHATGILAAGFEAGRAVSLVKGKELSVALRDVLW
jgi:hypothetical protein